MQHACTSAERPRTTSGAVQANRTNDASATPLGPVWEYARYGRTKYMSHVDAACVYECGAPTHDERCRASKSHEWCHSDATRARVGVRKQSEGPSTCRMSMQHACTSAERPRTTSGAVQANRTNGASATPLELVWMYPRYPLSPYIPPVDAACVHECGGPTHDERRRAIKSHEWCHSDAAGARVGVRTLRKDQVHVACRCSMRVRVRSAHARRAAPCEQIAQMTPQRRN